ncbi:MAG: AarF/UbiB family protein, partial [bacterium]
MTPPNDCSWGAFSDEAPWILSEDNLAWANDATQIRLNVRREVPDLTTPRRVPPLGRLFYVVCVLGTAVVPWLVRKKFKRFASAKESNAAISLRLRKAVETLGPTYIKLGQIISSGEGLFPGELVEEFKRCRDQVPAEPFETVRLTIEQDMGCRLNDVFLHIDTTPLAAASIAQVHAATLTTGESVVVKVQRPNIGKLVRKDLRVMAWLAPFLIGRIKIAALANPPALVELFAETIVEELDFRMEAANMVDVSRMLHRLNQTGYI